LKDNSEFEIRKTLPKVLAPPNLFFARVFSKNTNKPAWQLAQRHSWAGPGNLDSPYTLRPDSRGAQGAFVVDREATLRLFWSTVDLHAHTVRQAEISNGDEHF